MKRYFSYDDQNNFELHDTLAEAKAAAEKALDYCSDEARSEGWPESVDEICFGELRGQVVETLREPWDTEKHGDAPEEGCERVDYALLPTAPPGYVLVPIIPTDAMRQAAHRAPFSGHPETGGQSYKAIYHAMIAAAPEVK